MSKKQLSILAIIGIVGCTAAYLMYRFHNPHSRSSPIAVGTSGISLATGSGSASLPSASPYNNFQNYRIQFRLHNMVGVTSGYKYIISGDTFYIAVTPTTNSIIYKNWRDGGSGSCA